MIGDDYPTGKNSERKACDSGGYYGVISQVEELCVISRRKMKLTR